MPTREDPRETVRFGRTDHAVLRTLADQTGVAITAFIRETAVRYGPLLAREVADGRVKLRRANGTGPAASSERPKPEQAPSTTELGAARALAFRRATGGPST